MQELVDLSSLSLTAVLILFVVAAVVIAVAGTRLTRIADQIADFTKLGEALIGAVLLGAITSLAGTVTSFSAAMQGYPDLAVSNAIGGIAVQTFFLSVADMTYRKANLEHASASFSNLLYSVLLIGLLGMLLLITSLPEVTVWQFHPGSPLILIAYLCGMWIVSRSAKNPMWRPTETRETVEDIDHTDEEKINKSKIWALFALYAALVVVAGYFVSEAGIALVDRTVLSESFVGGLITAIVTSLPELIVSVSAVRQGSVTMAVSNIVGGNSFEVIVVALVDFFYAGSILHAASSTEIYIITLTILLMTVLLMGLLYRQKQGLARIGWESVLIFGLFVFGYFILYFLN